jgi:uncharacterized membrane protein YdjX (TVP38/TMEM64 family)
MQPGEQFDLPAPTEPTPASGPGSARKNIILGLLGLIAVVFVFVELNPSCLWEDIQDHLDEWQSWAGRRPVESVLAFALVYAAATTLGLPVVTIMCLLAGALFGRTVGTAVAGLGYTVGVTCAFLLARWLFRDWVRGRFGGRWLDTVERGVERDGAFYLLTLRLMPTIPFSLVNLLMALTPIRTRTYALISGVGVLPLTFLYAGVGTELASVHSPQDILSWPILGSLAALAVLPLVARQLLRWWAGPIRADA